MGRERGQKNLSKYCRQPCPLSGDFPKAAASSTRGSCRRGVLLSGSTSRSLARGSARSGGRADRSSVNRSISQAENPPPPKEFPPFFRQQVPLCARFSSASFHRFSRRRRREYIGRRKNSLVSYSISIVSLLNGSFFSSLPLARPINGAEKVDEKVLPGRDDLSMVALSATISAIIQVLKLAHRGISKVVSPVTVREQLVREKSRSLLLTNEANRIFFFR